MTKLLLVPDVPNWAWWYRAKSLQKFAPTEYNVTVLPHNPFVDKCNAEPDWIKQFDSVFSFSWTMSPLDILAHAKRSVCLCTCNGLLYDRQREGDWRSKIVTASRNVAKAKQRLHKFDGVVAVNRVLFDACKQHNPNTVLIPSGVDTETFTPGPKQPVNPGKLTIGWCGQRRCNVKGLEEILKPLKARLSGPEYEWRVNDRDFGEALSREDMVKWYHGIDVFLSTSIIEGTPSPPFEAAACSRVVLSTDVGCVSDWDFLGDWKFLGEHEMRCPSYHNAATAAETVDWFATKLDYLRQRPGDMLFLGMLLRDSVRDQFSYTEAGIAKRYLDFIAGVPE